MSELTKFISQMIPQDLERNIRFYRDQYFRRFKEEKLPSDIFSKDVPKLSISFCTTCMNRFFHLKHTIEKNIESNLDYPKVEFVLLNYNSADGLDHWVRKNLRSYIDQGYLNYYRTDQPKYFHAAIAKNVAHKLAKGDIVCNLDGDNFTGKYFAYYINYLFHKHGDNSVLHFRKAPYWGTEGRIVYRKKDFLALGGHDESFYPAGHEDHDLLNRAKAKGLKYVEINIENFLKYLSNTTKEKSSNFEDENADYYDYETNNRNQSNQNIANGKLESNIGIKWGHVEVYKNFSEDPYQWS